jgi:hypothetical protein
MTPRKDPSTHKRSGRPPAPGGAEYKWVFGKHAYRFALLGYSNEEIAKELDVSFGQFRKWCRAHPEFLAWIKKGRNRPTARVAAKLYTNAVGQWVEDTDTKTVTVTLTATDGTQSTQTTTTTNAKRRYLAPNVTAQIFWLKNRARKHWYDVVALPAQAPVDPAEAGKKIRDAVKAIRQLEGLDTTASDDDHAADQS